MDDKTVSYDYVMRNRRLWAAAGFKSLTTTAHEQDKKLVLSYADMLRAERLAEAVENSDSGHPIVKFVATRNIPRQAGAEDLLELDSVVSKLDKENPQLSRRVRSALHSARMSLKKARKFGLLMQAEPSVMQHEAKVVAYHKLASAYVKYASALVEHNYPNLGEDMEGDEDAD
jgi:hypothetical protein